MTSIGDNYRYNYQTIKDKEPAETETAEEVNQSVVESGKVPGKSLTRFCAGAVTRRSRRCSVPTDVAVGRAVCSARSGPPPWLIVWRLVPVEKKRKCRRRFKMVRRTRRATPYHRRGVLPSASLYAALKHAFRSWPKGADWKIDKIKTSRALCRQIDHVDRGLLKGRDDPQNEKVFPSRRTRGVLGPLRPVDGVALWKISSASCLH